jgi:hypothetical protein
MHRSAVVTLAALLLTLLAGAMLDPAHLGALAQRYDQFITPTPLPDGHYLVIGFLGGREKWDNQEQIARRIVLRLRARHLPGAHFETIENAKRGLALRLVREAFDRNRDSRLDPDECSRARVILFGQSFGGAAVVKAARELDKLGVPVLLTVQIDSVGRDDALIPANVRRAANLYQRNGAIIRGEPAIRAADPAKTTILGNWRFDYTDKDIDLSHVSWWKKVFRTAHTKMEFDPDVWARVEELLLAELHPPAQHAASAPPR